MKTKIISILLCIVIIMLALAGCSTSEKDTESSSVSETESTAQTDSESDADDDAWKSNTGTITLGSTITYEGEGISVSGTTVKITKGGDYTVTGTLSDGMIYVDSTEKVKLRLSDANITNKSGPAIYFCNSKRSLITLVKGTKNTLADGSSYSEDAKAALFTNDTLEIKGEGSLSVTGNYKHAIASDDDVIIEEGNITVKSAIKDGIHANDNITVSGGTLNITATSDGFDSEGDILISGGEVTVSAGDDGMHAATQLKVTAGTINITKSYEGLEGKETIVIDGGNIRINASDDALNSGQNMTLNGGYIYADCNGDGYDSNGNMTINGGTHIIYSGNNGNGPLDIGDRNSTFTINGGTVVAAGGNMGINVSSDSKQYSIWLNQTVSSDSLINISDSSGNDIVTFMPVKTEVLTFYSSDKLKSAETYTINTGGSHSGKASDSVYSGGSYSNGTQLGTLTMSSKTSTYGNSQSMGRGGQGGSLGR